MKPFAIITKSGDRLILNADKIVSICVDPEGSAIEIEGWGSRLIVNYTIDEVYFMLTLIPHMYIHPQFQRV